MKIEQIIQSNFPEVLASQKSSVAANFTHWLTTANDKLNHADAALEALALGKTQNLHQTMITLEEAKLSLQFLTQVRNRLMTVYQEFLREPI